MKGHCLFTCGLIMLLLAWPLAAQTDVITLVPGVATSYSSDRPHIVSLEGIANVKIEVLESLLDTSATVIEFTCMSFSQKWCVLPVVGEKKFIKVSCLGTECSGDLRITLVDQSGLDWGPKSGQYLPIGFSKEGAQVFFSVAVKDVLPAGANPSDYKLRFEADAREQDLENPGFFRKSSTLSMEVTAFPGNIALPRNTTEVGSDIMLTLVNTDEGFCLGKDTCRFYVKVSSAYSPQVLFSVKAIEKATEISFKTNIPYYLWVESDQVYRGIPNIYVFNIDKDGDLKFEINPTEGNPDIYLSLDESYGYDISKYHYKSDKDNVESIFISAHEREALPGKGKTVYCIVTSEADATYYLIAEWKQKGAFDKDTTPIVFNAFYSGGLRSEEVANFVLNLRADVPETIGFFVNLKVRAGNPDLYIKDCEEAEICAFTPAEIKDKKAAFNTMKKSEAGSAAYAKAQSTLGNIFLFSDSQTPDDSLYVKLNTVPGGTATYAESTGNRLPTFPNTLPISRFNMICIAVVGNQNAVSHLSEYTLMVNGMVGHSAIFEYRHETISLSAKDEKYYVYSPHSLPEGVKGITIQFEVSVGDASFYFSSSTKYPNAQINEIEEEVDNDQTKLESSSRTINIPLQKLQTDQVYMGFVAKKESLIRLMLSYWQPDPVKGEPMALIPNAPVYRSISKRADFMMRSGFDVYSFKSYSQEGKSQDIFVRVHQPYGNVVICAAVKDTSGKSQSPEDCVVKSQEQILIIPAEETAKQPVTEWLVFVSPRNSPDHESEVHSYHYSISLLGKNTAREIIDRGQPVQDVVTSSEGNLHYHDFWLKPADKYLTVIVDSVNKGGFQAAVVFSLKGVNFDNSVKPLSSSDSDRHRIGISMVFSQDQIRPHCELPAVGGGNNRLLADEPESTSSPIPLKSIPATFRCRVYVKVIASQTSLADNSYRLWVLMDEDRLVLTPGKQYSLPYPGGSSLKLMIPFDNVEQGVFLNLMGTYTFVQVVATAEVFSSEGKSVERSDRAFTKGIGPLNLNFDKNSLVDIAKYTESTYNKVMLVDISRYTPESRTFLNREPSKWPLDVLHFLTIQPSNQVVTVTLGEPIQGIVMQGRFRYFYLQLNSTDDATVMLKTSGQEDADLYIQKGQSFPDATSYYLQSTNWNSDEIYIPRSKNHPTEPVWYTIGVVGITPTCEFTLTVLQNSFKVVNLIVGQVFTTQISERSPLVIRHNWSKDSNLRAFFYSFDAQVYALTGVETSEGIAKSIPTLKTARKEDTFMARSPGDAREIKLFPTDYSDALSNLIAIYSEQGEATVTVYLYQDLSPLQLKAGDVPLKAILDKNEKMTLSFSIGSGEISEMVVKIVAPQESYEIKYQTEKFKLEVTKDEGSNVRLYTFQDNNKKDREDKLTLVITSKSKANKIAVSVQDSKALFKLVPGDTTVADLAPEETRYYYMELGYNSRINRLRLDLAYPVAKKLTYLLTLLRTDINTNEQLLLALEESVEDGARKVSQNIELRQGVYTLRVANPSKSQSVKTSIRFSLNDLREMEANGVFTGVVNRTHKEDIQLMVLEPGSLNITLQTCRSNVEVYLTENEMVSTYSKNELILGTDGKVESGTQKSFQRYYSEPTSVYLHVIHKGTNESEFTIASKFSSGYNPPLGEIAILPANVTNIYSDRRTQKLVARVEPPAFDSKRIKQVYPTASLVRYQVTVMLYMATPIDGGDREAIIDNSKYCRRTMTGHGIYQASTTVAYTLGSITELKSIFVDFDYKNSVGKEAEFLENLPPYLKAVAKVKVIITASYYEEGSTVALGSTVVPSGIFKANFAELVMDINNNRNQRWYETWWGIIVVVLLMILAMIMVLTIVYFGAHRVSGGYARIDPTGLKADVSSTDITQLEMAPMSTLKK